MDPVVFLPKQDLLDSEGFLELGFEAEVFAGLRVKIDEFVEAVKFLIDWDFIKKNKKSLWSLTGRDFLKNREKERVVNVVLQKALREGRRLQEEELFEEVLKILKEAQTRKNRIVSFITGTREGREFFREGILFWRFDNKFVTNRWRPTVVFLSRQIKQGKKFNGSLFWDLVLSKFAFWIEDRKKIYELYDGDYVLCYNFYGFTLKKFLMTYFTPEIIHEINYEILKKMIKSWADLLLDLYKHNGIFFYPLYSGLDLKTKALISQLSFYIRRMKIQKDNIDRKFDRR